MTNHYDVLGVPTDADAATIKRAYKRKASKAHPDKTKGGAAAMTAINVAYDTLSDPERRQRYDQTGTDGPVPTLDAKAQALMVEGFAQSLEQCDDYTNPVEWIAADMRDRLKQIAEKLSANDKAIAKLEKRRGRVKRKSAGLNLFHGVIDQRLNDLRRFDAGLKDETATITRALELLVEYEAEVEKRKEKTINVGAIYSYGGISADGYMETFIEKSLKVRGWL